MMSPSWCRGDRCRGPRVLGTPSAGRAQVWSLSQLNVQLYTYKGNYM